MIKFYLHQFPKFTKIYSDSSDPWVKDFHNAGFKSVKLIDPNHMIFSIEDTEYTWFVLKWS